MHCTKLSRPISISKPCLLAYRIVFVAVTYHEHAERHPKFVSGEWTLETVLKSFLDTFDNPNDRDGRVTREEFMTYYAGVSCTIDDDCYFDLLMRSSWGLPEKRTARTT